MVWSNILLLSHFDSSAAKRWRGSCRGEQGKKTVIMGNHGDVTMDVDDTHAHVWYSVTSYQSSPFYL